MMKNLLFILKIPTFLIYSLSYGQYEMSDKESFTVIAGYMVSEKIQKEEIGGEEYEIYLKKSNQYFPKKEYYYGTCFFVYKDLDIYLVTAEHVARNASISTSIAVNSKKHGAKIHKLGDIVRDTTNLNWIVHPHADVAVVQLNSTKTDVDFPLYPFSMISSTLKAPARDSQLTVFGYPLSLGVNSKKLSAISKTSRPSSGLIEHVRFDKKTSTLFYLLEDPSVSGFSGGPVISLLPTLGGVKFDINKNPDINKIVGLVHGSFNDRGNGVFAAIVPSKYIYDTVLGAPGFTGVHQYKYENGNLWSEVEYVDGEPFKVISNYKINGESQEKGNLRNGNGTRYVYDENSKLQSIYHYKEGREIKIEYQK